MYVPLPCLLNTQRIHWRSVVCCSGMEAKGEQRQEWCFFVFECIVPLSLWDKESWKATLFCNPPYTNSSIVTRDSQHFFSASLRTEGLIQCPWGTCIPCFLCLFFQKKGSTKPPAQSSAQMQDNLFLPHMWDWKDVGSKGEDKSSCF